MIKPQGIGLSGPDADLYDECLDVLAHLHRGPDDTRILSRRETDRLLRDAVLHCLRPAKVRKPGQRTTAFVRRLGEAVMHLRDRILAEPTDWTVVLQVRGASALNRPFVFGAVRFAKATPQRARSLARLVVNYEPTPGKKTPVNPAAEAGVREKARQEIRECFGAETLATVRVRAIDEDAAKKIAIATIRRTIDVLNFFAPFVNERPARYRIFLGSDGVREPTPWLRSQGERLGWSKNIGERFLAVSLATFRTPRARKVGLVRASHILAAASPTELELRIVNALAWAGRAEVEVRPEQSFLLYAIALEALLTKRSARGGVSERVRLRLAHIVGTRSETRRRIADEMSRLYALRSDLVHAGDASALTADDLGSLRELVLRAMTAILTAPRFRGIRDLRAFETWLDDRVFA